MRVVITYTGAIKTVNETGRLHSFNDKPAYIDFDGSMYWYDNGKLFKSVMPSGMVSFYDKYGRPCEEVMGELYE